MDVVADLPNDVLVDIFLRLPARQIACCRAVCRAWRSIISSPTFDRCHAQRPSVIGELMSEDDLDYFKTRDGEVHDYVVTKSIVFTALCGSNGRLREGRRRRWRRPPRTLWLSSPLSLCTFFLGAWHGVVCVAWGYRWPHDPDQFRVLKYVLWNPTTMACATINAPDKCGEVIGVYAHPETRRFHLLHASGAVGANDERQLGPDSFRLQRAGDDVWRELHDHLRRDDGSSPTAAGTELPSGLCMEASRQPRFVGLHGNLHWLVKSPWLVTLQVTFWTLEMPERQEAPERLEMARIGVLSGGRLCVFAVDQSTDTMAMWVLDNYPGRPGGSRWEVKERINLIVMEYWMDLSRTFDMVIELEVVEGVPDGEEVWLRPTNSRIYGYNLRRKVWHTSKMDVYNSLADEWMGVHRESIVESQVCFGEAARAVSRKVDDDGETQCCLEFDTPLPRYQHVLPIERFS